MLWFKTMFYIHVIMSVNALSAYDHVIIVVIATSSDRLAFAVVHLCLSPSPLYLSRERGQ